MCRVAGSYFRRLRTIQPAMSGKRISSVIAAGRISRAKCQSLVAAGRNDALEAPLTGEIHQHAG